MNPPALCCTSRRTTEELFICFHDLCSLRFRNSLWLLLLILIGLVSGASIFIFFFFRSFFVVIRSTGVLIVLSKGVLCIFLLVRSLGLLFGLLLVFSDSVLLEQRGILGLIFDNFLTRLLLILRSGVLIIGSVLDLGLPFGLLLVFGRSVFVSLQQGSLLVLIVSGILLSLLLIVSGIRLLIVSGILLIVRGILLFAVILLSLGFLGLFLRGILALFISSVIIRGLIIRLQERLLALLILARLLICNLIALFIRGDFLFCLLHSFCGLRHGFFGLHRGFCNFFDTCSLIHIRMSSNEQKCGECEDAKNSHIPERCWCSSHKVISCK